MSGPDDDLPAYSLSREAVRPIVLPADWPVPASREWAFGDARGAGVRVCIVDSGIDADHPLVGRKLERAVVARAEGETVSVDEDDRGDVSGHGTACAGIILSIAPEVTLSSVRVLGPTLAGGGSALIEGLRWAIRERHDIINLSLSTSKQQFAAALHGLADEAYFQSTAIFASAHNMPVTSYPWRFGTVFSVGSHAGTEAREYFYNPQPPVEFHARGVDVEIAWADRSVIRATGNSFAAPTMAAIAALALARRPGMTPFELKTVLRHAASNVEVTA